ncbi:proton-conducting transporter membrane subunit [Betaproteobacteria bacterium]|nr:proton-conducting transporter membrane subunit [Betaproteobacteria bacterium]
MYPDFLPIIPAVLPLAVAPLCLLIKHNLLCWSLTVAVMLISCVTSFFTLGQLSTHDELTYPFGGWDAPVGIEYSIDHLNGVLLFFISSIGLLLTLLYSGSLRSELKSSKHYFFYTAFLLTFGGLVGVIATADAFNAFVFIEISSLGTYILVALGKDKKALLASYRYLIFGTIGATFFVLGVGILFVLTGSLNFLDISNRLESLEKPVAQFTAMSFIIIGLLIKSAIFPLHAWLPASYKYAPSLVTCFFSAISTKVSLYLLIRMLFDVGNVNSLIGRPIIEDIFFFLALASIFFGSFAAYFEKDIKKLFAYSSISQVGIILIGISVATVDGLSASLAHFINHGLTKGFIFAIVCFLGSALGGTSFKRFAGIGRVYPILSALLVFGCFSLIGVPGTPGFITKFTLISSLISSGNIMLAFSVLLLSILSVAYCWRIVELVYFEESDINKATLQHNRMQIVPLYILLSVLAACMIYVSFDTTFTIGYAKIAAEQLLF